MSAQQEMTEGKVVLEVRMLDVEHKKGCNQSRSASLLPASNFNKIQCLLSWLDARSVWATVKKSILNKRTSFAARLKQQDLDSPVWLAQRLTKVEPISMAVVSRSGCDVFAQMRTATGIMEGSKAIWADRVLESDEGQERASGSRERRSRMRISMQTCCASLGVGGGASDRSNVVVSTVWA